MCHVIDKVVLHFCQLLLAEDDVQRKNKRYQQHKGENHRRDHKADRIENIILLAGEMYFHNTHPCRRIIQEQRLRIRAFTPLVAVIRTTVHFPSLTVYHLKVIVKITDSIVYQPRLDVLVQVLEINPILNRLVTGMIKHIEHHIIHQRTLIKISVLDHISQRARRLGNGLSTMFARNHGPRQHCRFVGKSFQFKRRLNLPVRRSHQNAACTYHPAICSLRLFPGFLFGL